MHICVHLYACAYIKIARSVLLVRSSQYSIMIRNPVGQMNYVIKQ